MRAIKNCSPEQAAQVAPGALTARSSEQHEVIVLESLGLELFRRRLPLNSKQVTRLCRVINRRAGKWSGPGASLIRAVENFVGERALPKAARELLIKDESQCDGGLHAAQRNMVPRIRALISSAPPEERRR